MGLTATWVFARHDLASSAGPEWSACPGLAAGWHGVRTGDFHDPLDVPVAWPGPVLVAAGLDSGFCLLAGYADGAVAWSAVLNEEFFAPEAPPGVAAAYGVPAGQDPADHARRCRAAAEAQVAWASGAGLAPAGADAVAEILGRSRLPVDPSLHRLLLALGLRTSDLPPGAVAEEVVPRPDPVQEPATHTLWGRHEPRLAFEVDTYTDLRTRVDDVAAWLEEARSGWVLPVLAQVGEHLAEDPRRTGGTPRDAALAQVTAWSVKGRSTTAALDERAWRRSLRRLRAGELREVTITLDRFDADGARTTSWFTVDLRSTLVEHDGPLPAEHPAQVFAQVSRPGVDVDALVEWFAATAVRFDAASGYLTADRIGRVGGYAVTSSPFEERSGARTRGRLDRTTRGVHWCTILGPAHLDALGSAQLDALGSAQLDAVGSAQLDVQGSADLSASGSAQLDVVGGAELLGASGLFHEVRPLPGSGLWLLRVTEDPEQLTHARVDEVAWLLRAVMPRRDTGNLGLTFRS